MGDEYKMPLNYKLPSELYLHLNERILKEFSEYRQTRSKPFESGGVLLGRVYEGKIEIEVITTPGKGDKQGVFFFHRGRFRAQSIVDDIFKMSNGEQTYLGEWHSHNEKHPRPSFKDKLEIKEAFQKSRLNLRYLLCIIVGNQNRIGNLWVGFFNETGMHECKLETEMI